MRNTNSLDKQLDNYLGQLNIKEKEAMLGIVKAIVENRQQHNPREDIAFISELDRRTAEYENGKAKVSSLDQLEAKARKSVKVRTK